MIKLNSFIHLFPDRVLGLVVRVSGYRSRRPGLVLGATRISGTGSTQPRDYNLGTTSKKKIAALI
jgi:hypothetical protein